MLRYCDVVSVCLEGWTSVRLSKAREEWLRSDCIMERAYCCVVWEREQCRIGVGAYAVRVRGV